MMAVWFRFWVFGGGVSEYQSIIARVIGGQIE